MRASRRKQAEMLERKLCKRCKTKPCVVTGRYTEDGKPLYKTVCNTCHKRPYTLFKKDNCEICGFIPVNNVQLDVDHKDSNPKNNAEDNLQTLCANCHRLKTVLQGDGVYGRNK